MTTTTVGSREARQNWRDLLDIAYTGEGDTIIERSGKAVAVLIPYEDYLAIQETLDDLRAARRAAKTYAALKQNPKPGHVYEEVRATLETREEGDD